MEDIDHSIAILERQHLIDEFEGCFERTEVVQLVHDQLGSIEVVRGLVVSREFGVSSLSLVRGNFPVHNARTYPGEARLYGMMRLNLVRMGIDLEEPVPDEIRSYAKYGASMARRIVPLMIQPGDVTEQDVSRDASLTRMLAATQFSEKSSRFLLHLLATNPGLFGVSENSGKIYE